MLSLSSQLITRCRELFRQCDTFKSQESLRAVFVTTELARYRDALREKTSVEERTDQTIDFLLEKHIFLPFLKELFSRTPQDDKLHYELAELSSAVEDEFTPTIIPHHHLIQLQKILTGTSWPDGVLKRAYIESMPEGWKSLTLSDKPDFLFSIVADLAKARQQTDRRIPLLELVDSLASFLQEKQDLQLQHNLRNWIDQQAEVLDISRYQVETMLSRAEQIGSIAPPFLLIILHPMNKYECTVQAWLHANGDSIPLNANREDQPISLKRDMPKILDSLFNECNQLLGEERDKIVVEFFLPDALLSYPIEDWPINIGAMPVKLGVQYKVVVRSLKRAQHVSKQEGLVWPSWKRRWGMYRECICSWQDSSESHQKTYQTWNAEKTCEKKETLYSYLHLTSTVCLALTCLPSPQVFMAAVHAGVPILLWPRKEFSELQKLPDLYPLLLSPPKLAKLPSFVQEQRNNAEKYKRPGDHLVLLWDDPERLPPNYQMAAPSTRKGISL